MKYDSKKWRKKFGQKPINMYNSEGAQFLALLGINSTAHVTNLKIEIDEDGFLVYSIQGKVDQRLLGES